MSHIKYALRQLGRRPALSVAVISMLALGIGATTAMFSLFHEVLVRPLPVPEPARLVNLAAPGPKAGPTRLGTAVADVEAAFSYPMFRDLAARQTVFTGIAAHLDFQANLAGRTQALAGRGTMVSGSYFEVLNLEPALGRLIGPQDEPRVGESAVVVLSHEHWRSRYGGDPGVVGETLTVNGQPLTVIGVAPEGFSGAMLGWRPQVFVPVTLRWRMQPEAPADHEDRRSHWLYLFARLAPGVTAEQASAAVNGLYGGILREVEAPLITGLDDEQMAQFLERRLTLEPGARGQSVIRGPAAQPLTLLLGVTGLVLLIVCVNIANLLLARGASRTGEMAIRASVGASRRRLASQLLIESAVLAAIGSLASLPVASITLGLITAMMPAQFADGLIIEIGPAAVSFAAGAALSTVLLFGSVPAWQVSHTDPGRVMKGQAPQSSGGRAMGRFRAILTTAQIAISMVLLVLAGLFAQSLENVARVNLGIDVDELVSFGVSPGLSGYGRDRVDDLYDRIEADLAAQPGVTGVGSALVPLIANRSFTFQVSVEGAEDVPSADTRAGGNFVGLGFFETLSIPLLAGRAFTEADTQDSPAVGIVNESFVRKFGLGDDALGKRFGVGSAGERNIEIVGVVSDTQYGRVKGDPPPQYFQPRRQVGGSPYLAFYVRGEIGADALMRTILRVVQGIDPNLPVSNLTTMEKQVEDNIFLDRLITMLSAAFAGLATLLAAVGLYGVLAYNVAQRTRELGLRLALGADPGNLRAMVLGQVAVMTSIGIAIGLAAAVGLGRAASALLFGLSGYDPAVIVAAAAVLSAVVLGASYVPALRASGVAPMEALRHE